jgi:iron(III) transport system permease protein
MTEQKGRTPVAGLRRRVGEFALMFRDPVLAIGLAVCAVFLAAFVIYPILRTAINGFFDAQGRLSLGYFARYFDAYYGPLSRRIFRDTLVMGLLAAGGGTLVGFIFAYAVVRCRLPGRRAVHLLALVPTVSPPFAIALSSILLFGRNGLVSRKLLGMSFPQGANDIYGMDGLVFVQVITFFSVAYLILRAMLERLDPSMEEAARSMGAGKLHIFRTVTLPLLVPGLAGSFLLLFVESLADLGNPLFIAGNVTVLSSQIFLAVAGEYDYQKASALAVVLLLPTLIVFLVQRYYVSRRSYISVTGKPTGGQIEEREGWIRWPFIMLTYAFCLLILLLYVAVIYGSFSRAWGIDFGLSLEWWRQMFTRGIESILDTTYLSILATPVAVLLGMMVAFLVVRKRFTGKETLDFTSNLGGAIPGTILGIGFVLAFSTGALGLAVFLYVLLALLAVSLVCRGWAGRLGALAVSTAAGLGLKTLERLLGPGGFLYLLSGLVFLIGLVQLARRGSGARRLLLFGVYLALFEASDYLAYPLVLAGRALGPGVLRNAVTQLADYLKVLFKLPPAALGSILLLVGVLSARAERGRGREALLMAILAVACGLFFAGSPLTLVGTPYIILAAFAVRSLPASVRAGVASLQQIDPSIEEASAILGADAQYTFRKVTLPLILPAIVAGLIFSFTRHMTSLSAIIFLVSPRWRIVTASILSEWEQGGISMAAAYSTLIIFFVLAAISLLYFLTGRLMRRRGGIDITWGA